VSEMTLTQLMQKLALDKLVETGVGLVSENTYAEICAVCLPVLPENGLPANIVVAGIRLIKYPFVPDGEIWPFEEWDYGHPKKVHLSEIAYYPDAGSLVRNLDKVPLFEEVMLITRKVSGSPALEDPEAKALYDCCVQIPTKGIVVEVGCQLGRSSSVILQVGQAIGYHSVFIDPYTEQPEYLKGWVEMMHRVGGVREHAFTLLCMRTQQAGWLLDRLGAIDMAFIDGDHEQAGVETDLRLVAERIKRGGYLTAHDYGRESLPTVKAAIDGWMDFRWQQMEGAGTLGVWRRK